MIGVQQAVMSFILRILGHILGKIGIFAILGSFLVFAEKAPITVKLFHFAWVLLVGFVLFFSGVMLHSKGEQK